MYCHRCGKELTPDAAYCHSCGARVGEYSPSDWWRERRKERWERHDWEPLDAAWGVVVAVGYLIIIGLMVFWYPDVFTLVVKYFESWQNYSYPVLPPHALGEVLIFLFSACGVWGIVGAGLRLAFTSRFARPLRDVVGGLFSLYVALILTEFYANVLKGSGLVLLFFVGLAGMVLLQGMITHFLPRRKGQTQTQPV